jgi:formylglycine-generating enzyme required for sulfatase activity
VLPQLKERGSRRWYVNGHGQTFAVVDGAGKFRMGSPLDEPERDSDEPPHSQEITNRFAIATKEVTRGQFQEFLRENPQFDLNRNDLEKYSPEVNGPRIFVTWFGAAAYCNWLSKIEGLPMEQWCYSPNAKGEYANGMTIASDSLRRTGYRLPTEAEWEWACRAGASTSRYYGFSTALLGSYAWYAKNIGDPPHPQRCGQLLPNDLGLFDMLGNVSEWCQESYNPYELGAVNGASGDIAEGPDSPPRVHRGGGFDNRPGFARSADRTMGRLTDLSGDVGFRPARTMP